MSILVYSKNGEIEREVSISQIEELFGHNVATVKDIFSITKGNKLQVLTCSGAMEDIVYFSNCHGSWGFPTRITLK